MSAHLLEPLIIPAADPTPILGNLERAIAGQATYLPLPEADPQRADLLSTSQRVGEPIDATVALVVATSGSTGTPKGAQLTAANLVSSADATHTALGGPGHWLLALPAHHIAGIQVLVRSLIAGVTPLCLDLRGGFDVSAFARGAARLAATGERTYTSLTPMQLLKAMDTLEGIEALRSFNAILVGGGPTSAQTLHAADRLRIRVVTTYGSSETSGGCVYSGRPIPGAHIHVAEPTGRIYLAGPMIAAGYRNHPDHEAFSHPGWFATSDAGTLSDAGVLTVSGRLDAVIDTGGLKLHPEILEEQMRAVTGVAQACVVGIPDPRLGQAVVAAYTGTATPTDILAALEDLPRWQLPKQLLRVPELPATALGKTDRAAVGKLFTANGQR
ncbi:o-succinylbenzoate--CoA ligase [Corynebacterium uberis]